MPKVYRSGWRRRSRFTPTPLSIAEWASSQGIHLWSKQREICDAVDSNKDVICKGGHQWGKSLVSAVVATHWIQSHPRDEVGVAILAPSWDQIVDGILLEIDKLRVKLRLPGKINLSKMHANWTIDGRKVLMCRSPQAREHGQSITGMHRRYLLVIREEGCGLDRQNWRNSESWTLNDSSKSLTIGNPLDEETAFGDCFRDESTYHKISVSTLESPAFTEERLRTPAAVLEALAGVEAVERWRATMTAADFAARVEGEFPSATQLQIFSRELIERCKALRAKPSTAPLILGLDPAAGGGDTCRLTAYREPALWDVTPRSIRTGGSDSKIAREVLAVMRDLGAEGVNIDGLGIGSDIARMLAEKDVAARNVLTGRPAYQSRLYGNIRSEMHAQVRKRMEAGRVAMAPNREMEEEFRSVRQKLKQDRRYWVEPKEDHAKRLGRSPGAFDSALLAMRQFSTGYGIASHAA